MEKRRYFINESEVTPTGPANHDETVNRRLLGPETVGPKHVEVTLVLSANRLSWRVT